MGGAPSSDLCRRLTELTRMRIPIILAVAALVLSGCNANQEVNLSSQTASQVFAGHYVDYNPYNPVSYAQNNTGRGGR